MTGNAKKPDSMDNLMNTVLAELLEMEDEAVLAGEDPEKVKATGLKLLDQAKAEAGRRRLAAARRKRDSKDVDLVAVPTVTAQEARAFLRQAANDGRYTLAARGLEEMSDEDAVRLFQQIKRLEAEASRDAGADQ
jgi:hypothetical protein